MQIWELDHAGWAKSQKVALFGGGCGRVPTDESGQPLFECDEATVEMIDFQDDDPSWQLQEPLIQPASILGGNATDLTGDVDSLDKGVPVAQIYRPSYFFGGPRPEIEDAPDKLSYSGIFQ